MTPELLLVIIVFVLLPLLQQLFQVLNRSRTPNGAPERPVFENAPAREEPQPATIPPPERPRATLQPRSAPHVSFDQASEKAGEKGVQTDSLGAGTGQRSPRTVMQVLRSPAGRRRAIVLMTVLGPCRALTPET